MTYSGWVLDAFCGQGGITAGYIYAGFKVLGVDLEDQPRYIGDEFVRGDAVEFIEKHGHEFAAIAASPPCQVHSALSHFATPGKHLDLIPQTRAACEATGKPYTIENVPGAPLNASFMLCASMFRLATPCGAELQRHRYFETNWWPGTLLPGCDHGWSGRVITVAGDHCYDPAIYHTNRGVCSVHGGKARDRRRIVTVTGNVPQRHRTGCHNGKVRTVSVTGREASSCRRSYSQRSADRTGQNAKMQGADAFPPRVPFDPQLEMELGSFIEANEEMFCDADTYDAKFREANDRAFLKQEKRRIRTVTVAGDIAFNNTGYHDSGVPNAGYCKSDMRETFSHKDAAFCMCCERMSRDGLSQAIPPPYSQFIAQELRSVLP